MTRHSLKGDKCLNCGQRGAELEEECPVGPVGPVVGPPPRGAKKKPGGGTSHGQLLPQLPLPGSASEAATTALRGVKTGQGIRTRRSWNDAQNARCLDALAGALLRVVPQHLEQGTEFGGEELKSMLHENGLEARHIDQWTAIDS